MQKRFLPIALLAIIFIIIEYSCTKLDTTTQGADLVTADNINTKADTLLISTQQGFFANELYANNGDSTIIVKNTNYILGKITNDGLFGKTDASIFVQFKPSFFPFYFGNAGDTVKNGTSGNSSPAAGFDSAVLCLSYKGSWGDTSAANSLLHIQVLRIDDVDFGVKSDTLRPVGTNPLTTTASSVVLGEKDITLAGISAFTYYGKKAGLPFDSVQNQIRIKLDQTSFAADLFNQDSLSTASNNAFSTNDKFNAKYKGFEIKVSSANGKVLHYLNLAEIKSRLEFHYKKVRTAGKDTLMDAFLMYTGASAITTRTASATANYIKRDYIGSQAKSNTAPNTQYLYLQTTPGTYGKLQIPELSALGNRIIHRAYLVIDQVPAPGSPAETDVYSPPPYMYLDLKDTVISSPQKYKPVYFDLTSRAFYNPDATSALGTYFPTSNVDVNTFGGVAQKRYDVGGSLFYRYEINLTRYVQHIVTNKYKNYDLRLYSPFSFIYPQYPGVNIFYPYFNPLALGRVRVGGGALPGTDIHKMKMIIVYSEIK